jgi:hypothetical protein
MDYPDFHEELLAEVGVTPEQFEEMMVHAEAQLREVREITTRRTKHASRKPYHSPP